MEHPIKFFERHEITPRPQQISVMDGVQANWDKYRYFALSLPVGTGKTYIADAIAYSLENAYILTSTLHLQDQYEKSWSDIVSIKGRGNYTCNVNPNFTVDAAPCTAQPGLKSDCIKHSKCAYYNQKALALRSKAMITNPVYMLYSAHCGIIKEAEAAEGEGSNPWVKRSVMIIDEAHNLENHLVSFAESMLDLDKLEADFGVDLSKCRFTGNLPDDYQTIITVRDKLMFKALELQKKLEDEFPPSMGDSRAWARGITEKVAERIRKMQAKCDALDKQIQPIKIFFNTHETFEELERRWMLAVVPNEDRSDKSLRDKLKMAPVYGDFLFHAYFGELADKFVFLSATLGTKQQFCKELGIEQDELYHIETDSPFDPAKSPIIATNDIVLSRDKYDQNIAKLGAIVTAILEQHDGERGIIHSVTYKIAQAIFEQVPPKLRKRLLCRDMDTWNGVVSESKYPKRYSNQELVHLHETQGEVRGSVLLSPSMMEGVDLYDDLSTFQILIKMPWGNLGDRRIKLKSEIDGSWYSNRMWLNVMQASGRSTRNETDSSVTYVLDAKFDYFYNQWKRNLPSWFKDRVVS